jgi:16S rRNA (uracil1498-N3)-methyltransferase
MADRFYTNCPLAPGPVVLQGAEHHHLTHVLRARPGDPVILFNGDGHEYPAEVTNVDRRQVEFEIHQRNSPQRELGFQLLVAAPVPKGDRAQFLVEKLTELGVTSYVPLRTQRSVVHPRDAGLERFQRYVIEASKQCGRNVLMNVEPIVEWRQFCPRSDLPAQRWLAHLEGATPKKASGDHVIAVGPEGGFTDEELQLGEDHRWQKVALGTRILRVETAAMVMAALVGIEIP